MAATNPARYVLALALALSLSGLANAQGSTATAYLYDALNSLCSQIQDLIPVAAMLLIVSAAVIYSIGQMFGAETRARATVWATSCLTGAIIGVLIASIAPSVLSMLAGTTVACS